MAWRLYWLVESQHIYRPDGVVIGFSLPALFGLMDCYGVKKREQRDCFEKVKLIWDEMRKKS